MKRLAVLALLLTLVEAKRTQVYVPPHFWTHMHTYNCKQISDSLMRCTADIEFAGYSLAKPESNVEQYPKARIKAE